MADGSIIIIGAGVAGLSAGCYARMNGFDTGIFEMHDKPGGVCTAWKRKGYTFDGCIHWLVGSKPGTPFNRVWTELGALEGREIVNHEEFCRVELEGGKALVVYTDADRLEAHMKELSPADSDLIGRLARDIRAFTSLPVNFGKPAELMNPLDAVKALPRMLPVAAPLLRWMGTSVQSFAVRFADPFLREAFPLIFDVPDFPMLAVLSTLGWMHAKDAGYPVGGSLEFARAIERRYLDLGGEVNYRSRVREILVERDRAVGVRLEDGTEHRADVVISAADGHSTIFEMLHERYIDREIRGYYATFPLFPPLIQVSLGVARDLSGEPHTVGFPLARPLLIAGKAHSRLGVKHFCYDPTMAPAGHSSLVVYLESDYDYWKALSEDEAGYRAEKEDAAAKVIEALDERFGAIKEHVEAVDVATPLTYERYTGNWRGSYEGWLINSRTGKYVIKGMKRELPGLENFFMIGQWVSPGGGLPPAALHGREIVQLVCARRNRPFRAD